MAAVADEDVQDSQTINAKCAEAFAKCATTFFHADFKCEECGRRVLRFDEFGFRQAMDVVRVVRAVPKRVALLYMTRGFDILREVNTGM